MVRREVRITTTDVIVTVPAGATTGTVSVPTTADTIDEVDETFSIANGTVSATGTLSTITMRLWQRSLLLRLPKDLMWYSTLP
jgi:hydroxyethylthiazole kinase-like sugar kinase family protein